MILIAYYCASDIELSLPSAIFMKTGEQDVSEIYLETIAKDCVLR